MVLSTISSDSFDNPKPCPTEYYWYPEQEISFLEGSNIPQDVIKMNSFQPLLRNIDIPYLHSSTEISESTCSPKMQLISTMSCRCCWMLQQKLEIVQRNLSLDAEHLRQKIEQMRTQVKTLFIFHIIIR